MREDDDRLRFGMQVLIGALATGVAAFLAVAWYLWNQGPPREPAPSAPLLSQIAAGTLVAALLARFVVSKAMGAIENGWRQALVVGAALIEGAGLFGCVAYFLEGTDLAFGVGAVAILLIFALQFPTQSRWDHWTQQARLRGGPLEDHYDT